MNTVKRRQFSIITRKCEIFLKILIPHNSSDECSLFVSPGTLIKIIEKTNNNTSVIEVLDYFEKYPIWENLYTCCTYDTKPVHEDIWPFLIAIPDPEERLTFVGKNEHNRNVTQLKIGNFVTASGEPFRKNFNYQCIIRYVGLVPEMGPGYYFGLEILDLDNGYSPQANELPFVRNYLPCETNVALILTANWISTSSIEKLKFSAKDLFCGTLDRALSTFEFGSRQSSLRRSSRDRRSGSKRNSFQRVDYPSSILNQPSATAPPQTATRNGHGTGTSGRNERPKSVMDQHSHSKQSSSVTPSSLVSNLRKDKATNTSADIGGFSREDSSQQNGTGIAGTKDRKHKSSQSENLIVLDNEEYARYVENYERNLERQHHDIENKQPQPNIPSIPNIPNIPVSILKQPKTTKKKLSSVSGIGIAGVIVKPNAIMSLEDRDIVVIDKADIKESTKNESEVIVVDNPRTQKEVDLADILGTNWPSTAGDAAHVLNSDAGSYNLRPDRNKSANPISHLISAKNIEKKSNKESVKIQTEPTSSDAATKTTVEKKLKNSEPIYDNTNVVSSQIISLTPSADDELLAPSPLSEIPGTNLGVGSMVEVSTDVCEDLYGVIRWIGCPQASKTVMVGVELEDEQIDRPLTLTDGTNNGVRLFRCPNGRALFIHPSQCCKDRRFQDIELPQAAAASSRAAKSLDTKMFGQVDCPPVSGAVAPLKILNLDELEAICGKFKGIQGHHNSCYLDATLFAMFTFTGVFDSLLFRPPEPEDISHYEEVQKVLREEIVNPLRKNIFVRADRVMKLRQLLDKLSSVSGLTSEEKDPEEFLNSLLAQIMRADPFLKLSSGQDAFFYQLFVEKDERLSFPSVQQLFEQSFLASDIKLKEVPSCLIIQMPRFGKNYKMYPRILPSQVLDVTDIIEDSPRQCSVCGKLAEFECRECFGILQCGVGLESTAFCKKCLETVHSHAKRANHTPKEISVPQDFKIMAEHLTVPRLFMELFAVVCIETSHYVAFVKAGPGLDAPWCFFDSMADRKGEQNGYNIPEMVSVPDLPQWLSEEGARVINEATSNDKMLPEHAKRLLCDAYMCMYQSTDVMMYR